MPLVKNDGTNSFEQKFMENLAKMSNDERENLFEKYRKCDTPTIRAYRKLDEEFKRTQIMMPQMPTFEADFTNSRTFDTSWKKFNSEMDAYMRASTENFNREMAAFKYEDFDETLFESIMIGLQMDLLVYCCMHDAGKAKEFEFSRPYSNQMLKYFPEYCAIYVRGKNLRIIIFRS